MQRAGIALVVIAFVSLTLAVVAARFEYVVPPENAEVGHLENQGTRDDVRTLVLIGAVGALAGAVLILEAQGDVVRRIRHRDRPLPPPSPAEPTARERQGPEVPLTLFAPLADGPVGPPRDPTVEYLAHGLARADGELVIVGSCSSCGAPNVVLRNGETGVRYLACSTFPACRRTDVLRRVTPA